MRTIRTILVIVIIVSALLTACAIPPEEASTETDAVAGTGMPGHEHPMAPLSDMPAEVQAADARTQEAYRFAAANPDAAAQIPCYCGCVGLGHVSSYDCYWADSPSHQEEARGRALPAFEPHAVNCTVCVDITQDQMQLMDSGIAMADIRGYIDRHYAAYGPPTPLTATDAADAPSMSEH
jgi:hypothetical protein